MPTFFHKFSNFLFYIPVSDLNLVIVWASSMYLILLWLWQNPWEESSSRTEDWFWLMIIRISFHNSVTFEPVAWQYILALGACAKEGYPLVAPKKYREQERRRLTSHYPLQGHASNDLTSCWNHPSPLPDNDTVWWQSLQHTWYQSALTMSQSFTTSYRFMFFVLYHFIHWQFHTL